MNIQKMKLFNNILFYISIAFAGYVLISTYLLRGNLPDGTCPVDNNSTLFYISIALLIITFIFSLVIDKKIKKDTNENKETE